MFCQFSSRNRSRLADRSISLVGRTLWNELPNDIERLKTRVASERKYVNKYLLLDLAVSKLLF